MPDKERETQQIEEIRAHRDDAGEWEESPEDVEVKARRSEVVSFRIPSEELDSLEQAAARESETISQFVRKALALRIHGEPIGPAVEVTTGATKLVLRSHFIVSSTREAAGVSSNWEVKPPDTQAVTG